MDREIIVCQHTSCTVQGGLKVLREFQLSELPPGTIVTTGGCLGQCNTSPTVRILPDEVWYCRVRSGDVASIVEEHIKNDRPVARLLHPRFHPNFT